jgi:sec-independent protein translocase protein TatA
MSVLAPSGAAASQENVMVGSIQHILAAGWMPGGWEWIVILLIALLVFGKRLPDVARSVGKSLTEFKKGMNEAKESTDEIAADVKKTGNDAAADVKEASNTKDSQPAR